MEKFTFKKLYKELVKYFGKDNVEFTDSYGVKNICFGKKIHPENPLDNDRVFCINNDGGYYFSKHSRYGNHSCRDTNQYGNFTYLANTILKNIDEYIKHNEKYNVEKIEMTRSSDNDLEELVNCLMILKFENKLDEFYNIIKYYYFDRYNTGVSGFSFSVYYNDESAEENIQINFRNKLNSIYKNYELSNRKSFIKEFGIDILELSEAIRTLMYEEHRDGRYKKNLYFNLLPIEKIGDKISEFLKEE